MDEVLKIIKNDPWLEPYSDAIKGRHQHVIDKEKELIGKSDLTGFASGYLYFGLHQTDKGWTFREWAPNATTIYLIGDFNGWTDAAMTSVNTVAGMNNHIWKYELDATGGDTTAKFKIAPGEGGSADGWGVNWGGSNFPYGIGSNGGANIPVTAGHYNIIFNDIDGFYYFYSIEE